MIWNLDKATSWTGSSRENVVCYLIRLGKAKNCAKYY